MANIKTKLSKRELTLGSWVTIGHESIVEIMASAGFEWLTIDMEHTVIDLKVAQNLIATIQAKQMSAFVRVSKNEEVIIKRVMDAGADGVIVPMILNGEDAKKAVDYVYYPPRGKRGVGLARAQSYGTGFEEYIQKLNDNAVVIAQIEHIEAVNNLEEIISTPGIDGIIVGPYDLSASMGYPGQYHRDDVKEALRNIEEVCKQHSFPLGFHVIQPNHKDLQDKVESGYSFIAFSIDFLFLGEKARKEMELIK